MRASMPTMRRVYSKTTRVLQIFREMAEEENSHRRQLIDLYREKFGEHIPLVRRHDVKGFLHHEPLWMLRPLGLAKVRRQAEVIELETRRFTSARSSAAPMPAFTSCSAIWSPRSASISTAPKNYPRIC